MATTRNFALILALFIAAIAMAIGVTAARAFVTHTPVAIAVASLATPAMHQDG